MNWKKLYYADSYRCAFDSHLFLVLLTGNNHTLAIHVSQQQNCTLAVAYFLACVVTPPHVFLWATFII